MKRFILTQEDLNRLLLMIDQNPAQSGGSTQHSLHDPAKREVYEQAHRFYNYNVRKWIDEVSHD